MPVRSTQFDNLRRLRISFVSRTRVYLDHNATAPLHPAAREAMCAAFDLCGNASSVHAEGRTARAIIEAARAEVAAFAGGLRPQPPGVRNAIPADLK